LQQTARNDIDQNVYNATLPTVILLVSNLETRSNWFHVCIYREKLVMGLMWRKAVAFHTVAIFIFLVALISIPSAISSYKSSPHKYHVEDIEYSGLDGVAGNVFHFLQVCVPLLVARTDRCYTLLLYTLPASAAPPPRTPLHCTA
jgi:hypothetical protein